jgi:hypothetical protein
LTIWENHAMGTGQRLLLVIGVMMLPVCQAAAQTLPWPTDAPRATGPAPCPGERAPAASLFGVGGVTPPCMAGFAELRDDVQKRGLAAKAAGQRKASREEMCKHITAYNAAELKWVKYTEANATSCAIPAELVSQLKQVHSYTEQTKEKICAAGPITRPGGAPSIIAPSIFID